MYKKTFWAGVAAVIIAIPVIAVSATVAGGSGAGSPVPTFQPRAVTQGPTPSLKVAATVDYEALLDRRTDAAAAGNCTGRMDANGNGVVTLQADIAVLQLRVEVTESTVASARDSAAATAQAVYSAVLAQGVDQSDIVTNSFYINQQWDYTCYQQPCTPRLKGYMVSSDFVVKVRLSSPTDMKASNVLDAAIRAGGDDIRVNGLFYDASPESRAAAAKDARAWALQDALDKLAAAQTAIGVQFGPFVSVNINDWNPNQGMARPMMAMEKSMAAGMAADASFAAASTPINGGTLQVTAAAYIVVSICN